MKSTFEELKGGNCCAPCGTYELEGCANGVPFAQLSAVGNGTATTRWINLDTGELVDTKPAGFLTGACAENVNELAFSATAPTLTSPFGVPKDNYTTFVTDDGTSAGEILEMWKFDFEDQLWVKVPLIPKILTLDVTTPPTATGNTGDLPRIERNATTGEVWFLDTEGVATQIERNPEDLAADLISDDDGNALVLGSDNKLFVPVLALWDDDQVLTGDNSTNVTLTLTPETVPDPENPDVDQVNYTIKAEVKIDGTTIVEDPTTKVLSAANQKFDVLPTVQPTPTASGNTTNLNTIFKDASGVTWAVDSAGDAISLGSPETVTLSDSAGPKPSNALAGDHLIVTSDGTKDGAITEVWLFDGADWIKIPTGCTTRNVEESFTATAGQTSFTLTSEPTNEVLLSRNGATLRKAARSVSGTTVTYLPAGNNSEALVAGDAIDIFYTFEDCAAGAAGLKALVSLAWVDDNLVATSTDGSTETLTTPTC